MELQEFIAGRNIEVSLELGGEQDRQPIPRYEVRLSNGKKTESFVIFGDSESDQLMTPEDAFRALLSRVRLHECKVEFSSDLDVLCCETAARLKDFLGPDNYSDFLKL